MFSTGKVLHKKYNMSKNNFEILTEVYSGTAGKSDPGSVGFCTGVKRAGGRIKLGKKI